MTQLSTKDLIGKIVDNVAVLEREEIAILRYVAENDSESTADKSALLRERIENGTEILNENTMLLETVLAHKADGILQFLDTMPFRIAILRLKAAILLTEKVCGTEI